jgi:hypothetical protein
MAAWQAANPGEESGPPKHSTGHVQILATTADLALFAHPPYDWQITHSMTFR